jgi:hypothetical protein
VGELNVSGYGPTIIKHTAVRNTALNWIKSTLFSCGLCMRTIK